MVTDPRGPTAGLIARDDEVAVLDDPAILHRYDAARSTTTPDGLSAATAIRIS
jgi:hypothetical protein